MNDEFAERLRTLRVRAGLSQEELARRAGVSVRAVRDIEQGRVRQPRPESIDRLTTALRLATGATPAPTAPNAAARPRFPFEVNVLGPFTLTVGGVSAHLESTRQRVLLAILALQVNEAVPRGEIIDALWGDEPPETCVGLVHTYVARLRKVLAPAADPDRSPIARTAAGYLLRADPEQVDAARFAALVARAEEDRAGGATDAALRQFKEALALWRGPVLSNLESGRPEHPAAVRLDQRRLTAALALADLALAVGRPAEAGTELRTVATRMPFHEGLHARLMLLLAADGQQEAALRLFTDLRARLADQLGIEPGSELRAAHLRVLRQELPAGRPPAPPPRPNGPVPAQLPADPAGFAGRSTELARLDAATDGPGDASRVLAVTGMAGVGKTALVVHWAHRNRHRFPDGQLYVNLRGYAPGDPVRPIEALAGFLQALGLAPEQVPLDVDQAAGMYRTRVSGRRMLVVLDNAAGPEQLRPLLPGSPDCQVLITSRERLSGMVAVDGVRRVGLGVLSAEESRTLLSRTLPQPLARAEPAAVEALAAACAHLPLALRIAAASIVDAPEGGIGGYLARLAENRLTALGIDGDPQAAVRAAFDLSYTALVDPARRLFRLIGSAPVLDVTAPAAAAIVEAEPAQTGRLLTGLASAHLIEPSGPGRYTFHDLLRYYAVERAEAEDPPQRRATAVERLYTWYQRQIDGAADRMYPTMMRLPNSTATRVEFTDVSAAVAWFEAEYRNVLAAARHAAGTGPHPAAWRLVDGARGFLAITGLTVDLIEASDRGGRAAAEAGDLAGQAAMALCQGVAATRQGRYEDAMEHTTRMAELARRADWPRAEAAAYGTLGPIYWRSGQLARAVHVYQLALAGLDRSGAITSRATPLTNLTLVFLDQGRPHDVLEHAAEALKLYEEADEVVGSAVSMTHLGVACFILGRWPEALERLNRAVELHQACGNRPSTADTLAALAEVHRDMGDLAAARRLATESLDLSLEMHDHYHEANSRNVLGSLHRASGRHRDGAGEHLRALDLARQGRDRGPEVVALAGLAAAYRGLGDLDTAWQYVTEALRQAEPSGYRVVAGDALRTAAEIRDDEGDPVDARRYAERALAVHRDCAYPFGQAAALRLLVRLAPDEPSRRAYRQAAEELPVRPR